MVLRNGKEMELNRIASNMSSEQVAEGRRFALSLKLT